MNKELTHIFERDPFAKSTGMDLLDWGEGYAKVAMTITEDMLNFHGDANGGIIFSLADYAFSISSNSYGRIAVGVNTHMSFLTACTSGDQLYCKATEVDKNPRLALYKMEVTKASGDLVGSMDGMVYRKKATFPAE